MVFLGNQLSLKSRYKPRSNPKLANQSDMIERVKFCLESSVQLFMHFRPPSLSSISDDEEYLFDIVLYTLLSTWKKEHTMSSNSRTNTSRWQRLLISCRDKVRLLLAHLIAFVLFPAEAKLFDQLRTSDSEYTPTKTCVWLRRRQLSVARGLAHEVHYKQMLRTLLDLNLDYQYAMNLALHELLLDEHDIDMENQLVEKLLRFLKHLRIESPLIDLSTDRLQIIANDEHLCLLAYQEIRQQFLTQFSTTIDQLKADERQQLQPISQVSLCIETDVDFDHLIVYFLGSNDCNLSGGRRAKLSAQTIYTYVENGNR
jgi:hypothetical protein